MIPKKIHYCWFGRGEKPKLAQKCIASWKKYCSDYELIEWNEDNFEIEKYPYAKYCLDNRKWAFLSDFVRLVVIYEQGGIYFDTDVQLVAPIDHLLSYGAYFGFENPKMVSTGLGFGAIAGHESVRRMKEIYEQLQPDENGVFPLIVCPQLNTDALVPMGLVRDGSFQKLGDIVVLPVDYMSPYDDQTGVMHKTANTISIHWYGKSWMSKKSIIRSTLTKPFHRLFGVDCFERFKNLRNK